MQAQERTFAIITIVRNSCKAIKLLVTENDTKVEGVEGADKHLMDELAGMARRAMSSGRPTSLSEIVIAETACPVTIEVIRPKPSVIVFGGGHVGHAVALMANMVGYCVTVVDDREAFANRQRLPDPAIELIAERFESAAQRVTITSNTAIVIVTRGHQYDELCLRSVIGSNARYIGMIGSRRRVISVFKQLTESGVNPKLLERVHAPIGLPISAKSPQEIAVAILGEIIQTFNVQADSPPSITGEPK
jgi:xanthine dehydrogenase accessory factor